MGHRAGREFFDQKREWSERKDRVLTEYLPPYVQKVAHQLGEPVLIVDGFAGPGKYKDGKVGSPLLIRGILETAMQRPGVRAEAIFVERDPVLYEALEAEVRGCPWIQTRRGLFADQVGEIEKLTATRSVFLYLDPYTVDGLKWEPLDRLFKKVQSGRSVEILLNFNAESFVRRGLAALRLAIPDASDDDPDLDVPSGEDAPSIAPLDAMVGGDWWRPILESDRNYFDMIRSVIEGFAQALGTRFAHVCAHNIYAGAYDRKPKYALVFGSRHPVALLLMNDAMVEAREMLAERSDPTTTRLFEDRPEEIVPDRTRLTRLVLKSAAHAQPRKGVIEAVVRAWIGGWRQKEIRMEIEALLRLGRLRSATRKHRINDETTIWAT